MSKSSKKVTANYMNLFNYIKKIGLRLFKILVQSVTICFPVMFILFLVNSLLGVHVRFSYYLKLAVLTSAGVAFLLCILKLEYIFAKPVKKPSKSVPTKTNKKTQRAVYQKRRKRIS